MEPTSLDIRAFAYIVTLAAVVNGLGIVRWLTAFAEYLKRKQSMNIQHSWIFNLQAGYQFIIHIMMWWMLWGLRDSANFNFLTYLFLLSGPVLLFLSSSLLTPNVESEDVDIRRHFSEIRGLYTTVLILFWTWAILIGLVLRGMLAPTAPLLGLFLAMAIGLRATTNNKVHAVIVILNWLLIATFISLYAMQLGGNVAS